MQSYENSKFIVSHNQFPVLETLTEEWFTAVRNMINENHRDLLTGTFSSESKAVINFNPPFKHFLCPKADFFEACLRRIAEFCIPYLNSGSQRTLGEPLLFSTTQSRQFLAFEE